MTIEVCSLSPLTLELRLTVVDREVDVDEGIGGETIATWSRNVCGVTGREEDGEVGRRMTACSPCSRTQALISLGGRFTQHERPTFPPFNNLSS